MIKSIYNKVLKSVEINSWLLHLIKSIQILIIYPLIYTLLNDGESAVWMIFMLFFSLQNLFDLGFQNVLIRIVSQANTGKWHLIDGKELLKSINEERKKIMLHRIDSTLKFIYSSLTALFFILISSFGSIYIFDRVTAFELNNVNFYLWFLFIVGLTSSFFNRRYTSYLIGVKLLSLVKRTESIVNFLSLFVGLIFFLVLPSLITLVINFTFWQLVLTYNFKKIYMKKSISTVNKRMVFDKDVFSFIWPMAWKGTVSSLGSYGLVNAFALWFSSYANAREIVSFTYSLKILDSIRLFSRVPFYSNIPNLNAVRIIKPYETFFKNSLKYIQRSNVLFIIITLAFYFFGFDLLVKYSSSFNKADDLLWLLLCIAYYLHLNGAFHTHLYSMTNKVNSHISDTVSGVLIISFLFLFFQKDNLILFPVALIIGYGTFYLPWAFFYSKKVLKTNFLKFIIFSALMPLLFFLAVLIKIA